MNQPNHNLTPVELEIVKLIAAGATNDEIASKLSKKKRTVETHKRNIKAKMRFRNDVDIAHWAISAGLVEIAKP